MIAQHVLVFTLVIAFPIWDYFITRRMRDATSVEYRTQVYVQTLAWQWISSAVAVAVLGLPALFAIHIEPRPAWLPPADAFSGLAIAFFLSSLLRSSCYEREVRRGNSLALLRPSTSSCPRRRGSAGSGYCSR